MLACSVCVSTLSFVKRLVNNTIGRAIAVRMILNVCVKNKLASPKECADVIDAHREHFLYVAQHTNLTAEQLCERLDYCETPIENDIFFDHGILQIDDHSMNEKADDSNQGNKGNKKRLKIVHLTDVHLDLDYEAGTEADCKGVICCHAAIMDDSGNKEAKIRKPAGKYGEYTCDIPEATVNATVRFLRDHIKPDILLFTGDQAAHDVWSKSRGRAMVTEGRLARLHNDYLKETNTVISVGNHETVPANSFPYGNLTGKYGDMRWLYGSLAMQWLVGVNPNEYLEFVKHGRYAKAVNDYLIISLNTNVAYLFNVWRLMYYPDPDPDGLLAWLNQKLSYARQMNKKCIVIGHHPIGEPDISKQWTRQILAILKRNADIIALMLFGHVHLDSFRLNRSVSPDLVPVIISPSMATWHDTDPCVRTIELSSDDLNPLYKQTTWKMSLKKGTWSKEYDLQFSNMTMSTGYYEHYYELLKNQTMQDTFIQRYFKSSEKRVNKCDSRCREKIIAGLVI